MKIDSILFDLDGTLWDSVDGILLTWNRVITRHGQIRPVITRGEQEGLMGLPMDEIARRLFPAELPERQLSLMQECIQEENEYLAVHGGKLYDGLQETLEILSKKYPLIIVSNCQKGYIEAFLQSHHMEKYFIDHLAYGDTGLTKGENNKIMMEKHSLKQPVYVGDTQGDRKSALDAGIPFIYAKYGFGTVDGFDASIDSLKSLLEILE